MISEGQIQIGNQGIGKISLDNQAVSGEGGPHDARLVFPLKIEMYPRPLSEQVAVLDMTCSLHLGSLSDNANQIGHAARVDFAHQQFPVRSLLGNAPNTWIPQIRISLTQAQIGAIEERRHAEIDSNFRGCLRIEYTVVWLYDVLNEQSGHGRDARSHTIEVPEGFQQMGMIALMAPFWTVNPITNLFIQVDRLTWAEKALPGLGWDRVRLIEIIFPCEGTLVPVEAVRHLDEARHNYDVGSYKECVAKCREVRESLKTHLDSRGLIAQNKDGQRLGDVLAKQMDVPPKAPMRDWLNGVWQGWWQETNAAHHVPDELFTSADAEVCLLTTAALLQYLGKLR